MTGSRIRHTLLLTALLVCFAAKSFGQLPAITSLSPSSATAGAADFTLTVNGSGFAPVAVVIWNLTPLVTTVVSSTQLTASVPAALVASPGSVPITVLSLGITSSATPFIVNPAPVIASLSPASATAGAAAFTLTVNGSGFASSAAVQWNGTALTTTFASATQLTATVPAALVAAAGTATVTVLSGGVTSNGLPFTVNAPPAPTLSSINPSSATAGGAAFTLTVTGTNFVSGAVVRWNTTALTTTFVSATQLTAAVPAALIAAVVPVTVTVVSGSVTTSGLPFTINPPPPTISSISPTSATAGGAAFTLTVTGTNFVSGAVVRWNATALTTTFVSATQLTAAVPAALIASVAPVTVTVVSGSVTTSGLPFTINPPPPTISSISPTSATAGGAAFTLTVNGSNFVSGAVVQWNGTALTTTFVSASQLTAAVPAALIAAVGPVTVTVVSGSVTTSGLPFTINAPPPTIASLNPSSATAGAAEFTLTVSGTNFVSGAVVQWNGAALTTAFVSATQLTASVPASLITGAGNATVTVLSGGIATSGLTFTVNPAPAIANLNPGSATAGGPAFALTVNGSGFAGDAVVQWNGAALATTFVNAGQLKASVPAPLIGTQGNPTVTVTSGSVTSNGVTFAINAPPAIASLSPGSATAGGPAFTLTVNGSGFLPGSVIHWNELALSTSVQSANEVTAPVSAALITSSGTTAVTVTSGGVTSNTAQFTIGAGPAITTLDPSSATAGGPAFTLAVIGSNFASGAFVQWNGSALTTTVVSSTRLTAAIQSNLIANPGTVSVKVNSSNVDSNPVTFVILNGPTISSLSPNITTAGGGDLTLTVNGSGFTAASVVTWNGAVLPTSFVNPNRLTASVAAALTANSGTANVTVTSGGVTFQPGLPFTIVPGPAITLLSPSATTAGGPAFTLIINGSGFGPDSVAQWNGTALPTTIAGATQLTASVSADLIANVTPIPITVVSGGVTSNSVSFDVASGPTLASLSPTTVTAGGGQFTLTVNGTGFTPGTITQWNGTTLATTFVKATQLTATVPASLLASAGTAQITAVTSGVSSNALSLVVSVAITSLSPAAGSSSGQPFTLTVTGSGFTSSSVVEWNGVPLETTFGSATQLTAAVPGNLSQNPGSAQVSVLSNGVLSNPIAFALVYPLSAINLSGLTATPVPTQPLSVNLQLASGAPTDLQGTLALSFVPSAAGVPSTYIDPALQFASGGTTYTFTIAAGTTTPATAIPNIQQGTVAGQITVTLTSLSTGNLNVLPLTPVATSVAVPPIAPVIESCAVGAISNGAFSVQLDAYSTPRDLSSATYIFNAAPGAQITVTGANGGQVTGTTQISVPVTTQLSTWFAASASQPNGSVFSLQAPFTISGDPSALQSVGVTLTNSIGASAQFACSR